MVIDSRSCRSAPSCFDRGIDGGKKIRGVKINVAVDKYGVSLAIDVSPANRHDTKGIVPVLRSLAEGGFQGGALGDLGYRGERLAKAGEGSVQNMVGSRGHCQCRMGAGLGVETLAESVSQRAVVDRTSNLQQQISTSSRPAHLLAFLHAAIDQEVRRAFRHRRANTLDRLGIVRHR